jgi:RHS repeat-associated protein
MPETAMSTARARRRDRVHRQGRKLIRAQPFLERLESRLVLSSVSWINPNGGDWDTATNWSGGMVPKATDNVAIGIAVSNPITHDTSAADSVRSVTSSDPIVLSGGSLSIESASTFSSTVTLAGGTLAGGPISLTNGATLVGVTDINYDSSGTLSAVTLDGTLDLATNNGANVAVTGGLTLNGTIEIGDNASSNPTYGELNFVGAQTLSGTGSIVFAAAGSNAINTASGNGDSGKLTIGSGITIEGKNGTIGNSSLPLINQGTIDDDVKGGLINVYGANWSNTGALQATSGGDVDLNGSWTSSGSITADASVIGLKGTWSDTGPISLKNGSAMDVEGSFDSDVGANIGGSGGNVYLVGTANNQNSTLTLNDSSLSYLLDGGTIDGGTVSMTNGTTLVVPSNNFNSAGTLSGVTLDGTLDLATNNGATITITDGLTLNGIVAMGNAGGSTYGELDFVGAQTLSGTGSIVFGARGNNGINTAGSNGDSGALTIGSGITIDGKSGTIGYNGVGTGSEGTATPLANQGTIDDDVKGGVINVYGANWTNTGTLEATSGGELGLNGSWTSSGPITADDGLIETAGTWTDFAPITAVNGGGYNLEGNYSLGAGASLGGNDGGFSFGGTLNNAGATLALNDPSLRYLFGGGVIEGGTVAIAYGAALVGTFDTGVDGTLDGVVLDGTLDLSTNNQANVTVRGGLTLNGTIDIGNDAAGSATFGLLNFVGAQTLSGTGTIAFGNSTSNQLNTASYQLDSGTLTIGSGITIHGKNGTIGFNDGGPQTPIVNQGAIAADVSHGSIRVDSSSLSNSGSLESSNGAVLSASGSPLTCPGNIDIGAGSSVAVTGALALAATSTLRFELGGSPSSGLFGSLTVGGAATLAGTLSVAVTNGYVPSAGDRFGVIGYASETGAFTSATGLSAGRTQLLQAVVGSAAVVVDSLINAADLAMGRITVPASGVAGQDVTISYTATNDAMSSTSASSWVDSVYLTQSTTLDPFATLIGHVQHTGAVAGMATYSGTLTAPLPGVVPGSYHVLVLADSEGFVPDANRANNLGVASTSIAVDVPALTPGVTFSGTIADGQDEYFRVDLPAGPVAQITASFATTAGGALYERFHVVPDQANYDELASSATNAVQQVLVAGTHAGTYYLLVEGRQSSGSGQPFSITVDDLGLDVLGISPNQGSNTGVNTVTVYGSGFTPGTIVTLVAPDGTDRTATRVALLNNTVFESPLVVPPGLVASFDLTGLQPGTYDVHATEGTMTSDLRAAFTVTALPPGQIRFNLYGPGAIRPHQPGTYLTFEYKNTGGTSVPAPTVTIEAQNAVLGTPIPGLSLPSTVTLSNYGGGSGGPASVLSVDPRGTPSVTLIATGPPGQEGTIPPGFDGYYTIPFEPSTFGAHVVSSFSLLVPPQADTPIDWSTQEATLRPSTISPDAWSAIFANFVSRVGDTYGQYQELMQEDGNYLSEIGEPTTDPAQLLAFEFQIDDDSLPTAALASTTDASAPAPGLPFTFGRVFVQTIAGRYQLGPFGCGWADTWDLQATADESGNVSILGRGTVRFFTLTTSGTYQAAPGDYETLTLQNGVYTLREKDGTLEVLDSSGRLSYEQDPNGNRITATYDNNGELTQLTDSDGQRFKFAYNAQGLISQLTDQAGRITTFSYDPTSEELLSVTGPDGTTSYTYDNLSNIETLHALLSIANPDGTHQFFQYDSLGRLVGQSKDGGADGISYAYDVGPGGYRVINALGASTTVLLNDAGETAQVINPLGAVTSLSYDANFNLVQVVAPTGITSSYKYDTEGNVIQEVDPLGNVTNMTYGPTFNQLTSLTDARGNTTQYTYDNQGNLLDITYPDNSVQQFSYDPLGSLTQTIDQNGDAVENTYNAQGLVTQENFADGSHTDFTYDDRGNMLTAADASGTITMQYNVADQLTSISYPTGLSLRYTYDAGGRRIQMVDQTGFTVNYSYDAAGRLAELTDASGKLIVTYSYDAAGRLAQKHMGNGTRTVYTYDADGSVLSITNYAPDQVTVNSLDEYTYGPLGNVLTDTNQDGHWSYSYDADSQLIHAVFTPNSSDPDGLTAQDLQYAYDPAGNRVSATANGVMTAYTTNNMNGYIKVGTASYSYDANGNLTSIADGSQISRFTYNDLNQLTGSTTPGGSSTYHYDPLSHLMATTANGQMTQYLVDPTGIGNVVGEYDGSGNLIARYTYGLGLTSRVDVTGAAAYYDFNAVGSTTGITTPPGSYANTYSYGPFGEQLAGTGTIPNPFSYVGQWGVLDEVGDLSLMRSRLYDSTVARFIQQDPIGFDGGDQNLYRYVGNDPVDYLDPVGPQRWNQGSVYPDPGEYREPSPGDQGGGYSSPGQTAAPSGCDDPLIMFSEKMKMGCPGYRTGPPPPPQRYFPRVVGPLDLPLQPIERILSEQRTPKDPNDITGPGGFGPSGFVSSNQSFPYTIQFQNQPTATAPAQVVEVTETLDPNLDWSTFQLGDFGFGGIEVVAPPGLSAYSTRLDLRSTLGLFVDVTARLNLSTGEITWTFTSIDPSTLDIPSNVLSGFLPPDQKPPQGEAFINYTVRPKASDTTGAVINAKATVVFDAGLPDQSSLDTAPIFNAIDTLPPTSTVSPLPATESSTSFPVSWSGQDDPGGSGIAFYNIDVSTNGGPFTIWQADTTQTSATFTGVRGDTYGFYSVATDNVGNVEATPTVSQASTQIGGAAPTAALYFDAAQFQANVKDGSAKIQIDRSGIMGATVTVVVSCPGGPDVAAFSQTISFGPNVTSQLITVPIANDGKSGESDVSIPLALSSPGAGATLGSPASATLVVHDNNPPSPPPPPPLVTVTSSQVETIKVGKGKKAKQQTVLVVGFSGDLSAAAADNTNAYQIAPIKKTKGKGRHGKPGTTIGRSIPPATAVYNASNETVTLTLRGKPNLANPEQLTVDGALVTDGLGRLIDGSDDGKPGSNYVAHFSKRGVTFVAKALARARNTGPDRARG